MFRKINFLIFLLSGSVLIQLTSCSLALPSFHRTNQNQSNEISINNTSQIEALKRNDYNVLRTTTGSAFTSRFFILFFPIGKYKTNSELYENAYYDAVDNLPNADALILPRQKIKKLTVPLLFVTYSQREITVSGVGISVKDKALENLDSDVPFTIAKNYYLKSDFKSTQLHSPKINTQLEFERIFEAAKTVEDGSKPTTIDFSKQYVVVVFGKTTSRNTIISPNNLKLERDKLTLHYQMDEGEKQGYKTKPFLILVLDKKFQGNLLLKKHHSF